MNSSNEVTNKADEAFKKLSKASSGFYLWIIAVLLSSIVPSINGLQLKENAIIFASTGVLMFTAIFYCT